LRTPDGQLNICPTPAVGRFFTFISDLTLTAKTKHSELIKIKHPNVC